jgi:hypothetical protein
MDVRKFHRQRRRLTREQLEEMTEGDLLELKSLYDADSAVLGGQLDAAKGKAMAEGHYSDSDWYSRATLAKRIVGQASQTIQNELGRRKRNKGNLREEFSNALLEAMDTLLAPEVKIQIVELAKLKCGDPDT